MTVGSALDIFGGSLAYADVVKWHRQQLRYADHDTCRVAQSLPAAVLAQGESVRTSSESVTE